MLNTVKPRRRMRLPQLSKANRIARRRGPTNEFIAMCHYVADREEAERLRYEFRRSA